MQEVSRKPRSATRQASISPPGGEANVFELVRLLLRNWPTISFSIAGTAALALAYLFVATPVFDATSQLLIETRTVPTFREQIPDRVAPLDTAEVESQLGLLRSERIAARVVRDLKLAEDEEFLKEEVFSPLTGIFKVLSWISPFSRSNRDGEDESSMVREAIERIRADTNVWRVGLSHVLEVTYQSPNRERAAEIANAIAESYIADQLETRGEAAKQGSLWLEQRIDYLRERMNVAALRVKEFRARRDYRIPDATRTAGEESSAKPGTTLEELEAQAETYRKIYESYLQAYADSVQRQSYPVTNARIITRAAPPDRKSHPRGLPILAVSLVVGGIIGAGIVLLRHGVRG